MAETRKLYYEEPRAFATEAKILELRDSGANTDIILDRTVCYPEGGGQPCDRGTIGGSSIIKRRRGRSGDRPYRGRAS